jgi:hypothetical protein
MISRGIARAATAAAEHGEVITRWSYDAPTGTSIIERAQDVSPILEANKILYTADDGYSPSREFRRVATIPKIIVEQWMREGVNLFDKNCRAEIRRRLNDSTNLHLRTAPGRL